MYDATDTISDKSSTDKNKKTCEEQGWYFDLRALGEKGLMTPKVIGEKALFTTYLPPQETPDDERCGVSDAGSSLLYVFELKPSCGGVSGDLIGEKIGDGMVQLSTSVQEGGIFEIRGGLNTGKEKEGDNKEDDKEPFFDPDKGTGKASKHVIDKTFWMQQE